jgi:hypothetical protein
MSESVLSILLGVAVAIILSGFTIRTMRRPDEPIPRNATRITRRGRRPSADASEWVSSSVGVGIAA